MIRSVNSSYQKSANRTLLLNAVRFGCRSRSDLAESLELRASTITNITAKLLDKGVLKEGEGEAVGSVGRRPVSLFLNPEFGSILGIDLHADYHHLILTDIVGNCLIEEREEYVAFSPQTADKIRSLITDFTERHPGIPPLLGIGISLPGIVDSKGGVVVESWTLEMDNFPLVNELKSPIPVIVENDANAAAFSLLWMKKEVKSSFLYLLPRFHSRDLLREDRPSVGIGIGLVIDSRIHRGVRNRAGEFHSIFQHAYSPQIDLKSEELDLLTKNPEFLKRFIREVMRNILAFAAIIDPSAIYIGGDLANEEKMIRECIIKESSDFFNDMTISFETDTNGRSTPALGAARAWLYRLYTIPQPGNGTEYPEITWEQLLR